MQSNGLIEQINPDIPILAANLNFSQMKHNGLKAYEEGVVKEGVGAGGSVIASILSTKGTITIRQIQQKIEDDYKKIFTTSLLNNNRKEMVL
jgi:NaMN:DMB phosphoribosyltransferase